MSFYEYRYPDSTWENKEKKFDLVKPLLFLAIASVTRIFISVVKWQLREGTQLRLSRRVLSVESSRKTRCSLGGAGFVAKVGVASHKVPDELPLASAVDLERRQTMKGHTLL